MTTTYTWTISALDCKPEVGSMTDYVVTSHWRCTGDDGDGHTGQCYSTVSFEVNPDKPSFIPFNEITEEQAIQWTQDALGEEQVAAVYTSIDSQIESAINPPIVSPALPWL
nr:MAG: hypothetical protein [Caudoviricetes sp.]